MLTALFGLALLVAVAWGVAWQERRRTAERSIVYGVEDSIAFVRAGLSDDAAQRLKQSDLRRILEWSVLHLQEGARRPPGEPPRVAASLEAAQYVQDHAVAAGHAYDGDLIVEVLRLQGDYLDSLGAVGLEVPDEGGG